MAKITDVNLIELVPGSLKNDPNVLACVEAINGELNQVSQLCGIPAIRSRIDELNSATLDHMAWQVDSKTWRDTWPVALKRNVIKTVITEKAKKGTLYAVERALESLGSAFVLKEWWQYDPPRTPHTFTVTVSLQDIEGQLDTETLKDITLRLDDTKPVRSHYTLSLATQAEGEVGMLGAVRAFQYRRLVGIEA